MAKNKSLSDAIQNMINDIEIVADDTAEELKDIIAKDFDQAAEDIISEYYDYNVKYDRQYNLYDIYQISSDIKKRGHTYTITTTLNLNSDKLQDIYFSNSKKHQGNGSWSSGGQVEGDYVFTNFMEGVHPYTKFEDGLYVYEERHGSNIPNKDFKKYVKDYGSKHFDAHMTEVMSKFLKKYL